MSILIKYLLILVLTCNFQSVFAQTFEKRIDSTFNGCITYCTEMQDSYYFLGSETLNTQLKLFCFKTDKSGNLQLKNSSHILLNPAFKYAKDSFNNIIIADGNKLIKINSNLNILWTKTIPGINSIMEIKTSSSGRYILSSSDNKILFTDTSGILLPASFSSNYFLRDFELINDTLYALSSSSNNSTSSIIILQKIDVAGNIISQKSVNEFPGYNPQLLIVFRNENACFVFSHISTFNRTTIAATQFDNDFNTISSTNKTFHNLWVTLFRYNNNSFFIGGDYDGKASNNDVELYQMNNTLQVKIEHGTNEGYYNDIYLTDDGYILSSTCSPTIKKIRGAQLTSTNDQKKSSGLIIFPNPAHSTLWIAGSEYRVAGVEYRAEVFDLLGKLVLNAELIDGSVDISSLVDGVYMVRVGDQVARVVIGNW